LVLLGVDVEVDDAGMMWEVEKATALREVASRDHDSMKNAAMGNLGCSCFYRQLLD
jgi:hypothetical protein